MQQIDLKDSKQRREDLVGELSNEKKCLYHRQPGVDQESINGHIYFFRKKIKIIDKEVNKTPTASNDLVESTTSKYTKYWPVFGY